MKYRIEGQCDRWEFEEKVADETGEWPLRWHGDNQDEVDTRDYPLNKLEIEEIARWQFGAQRID